MSKLPVSSSVSSFQSAFAHSSCEGCLAEAAVAREGGRSQHPHCTSAGASSGASGPVTTL